MYPPIASHAEPPGFLDVAFDWVDEPLIALEANTRLVLDPVYARAGAPVATHAMLLRESVVHRLHRAISELPETLGMIVLDAHRPLNVQAWLWNEMVTIVRSEHPEWDDAAINAHARRFVAYPEHPHPLFTERRRLLFHAMMQSGFANYPGEWWHFEYGTLRWAAATAALAAIYNAV